MQEPFEIVRFSRRFAALAVAAIAGALVLACLAVSAPAGAQQAYGNSYGNFFGYDSARPQPRKRAVRRKSPPRDDTAATATVAKNVKEAEEAKEAKEAKKDGKEGKKEAKKETKPDAPKDPVYIVISLADQSISVYDRDGSIAHSRVSTGMPGHPTPMGVFSVIGKERWHRSNIYSGAPMPWMQRITWSGVAMHAGVVPGYPASHGCIRLPASFAPQLWGMTKMGARVVVARRGTTPFEVKHALLPLPKMQPAPGSQQAFNTEAKAPIELASISPQSGSAIATAAVPEAAAPKLLNPMEYAAALKQRATIDKVAAEKAAKEALAAAQTAGAEARQAVEDTRRAEANLKAAESRLAELDAAAAKASEAAQAAAAPQAVQPAPSAPTNAAAPVEPTVSPESAAANAKAANDAAQAAAAAKATAESDLAHYREVLDYARRHEADKTPASFAAVQTYKAAVAASEAAAKTLTEADRRTEPVTVLISKKEGRVFIRQDWKEVYEAPVTIRDPDRPLGTHLLIAVAPEPDGSAMRWSAITVPEGSSGDTNRKRSKKDAEETPAPSGPPSSAAEALDRVELPPGVSERIAELLWTGGALIVSDHARSDEMDSDTDIIVTTR